MSEQSSPHWRIDAGVVVQLGEKLVTDDYQAILELVKNSYDACAKNCNVSIQSGPRAESGEDAVMGTEQQLDALSEEDAQGDTQPSLSAEPPEGVAYIEITDDGVGMLREDLEGAWFLIAASAKRAQKLEGESSRARKQCPNRTPLGDKGLGRLGMQRLGDRIDVWTTTKEEGTWHVYFDWRDFRKGGIPLDEVFIGGPDQVDVGLKQGTRIRISDFEGRRANMNQWRQRLVGEMSHMISPYEDTTGGIKLRLDIDGEQYDLQEISKQLIAAASVQYDFDFDEKRLRIAARVAPEYLVPSRTQDVLDFRKLVVQDKGKDFVRWLGQNKDARSQGLQAKPPASPYILEFERTIDLADLNQERTGEQGTSPGPFSGQVLYYTLRVVKKSGLENRLPDRELSALVKAFAGVRVYRDGFEVRMPNDWLELGSKFTSATSYYELRPSNTLGQLRISADKNSSLEEVTDREGFSDTVAYRNLNSIMGAFVKFAGDIQAVVKRGILAYLQDKRPASPSIKEKDPHVAAKAFADNVGTLDRKAHELEEQLRREEHALQKVVASKDGLSGEAVVRYATQIHQLAQSVSEIRQEWRAKSDDALFLSTEIANISDRLDEFEALASSGHALEELVHEFDHLLHRLNHEADLIGKEIKGNQKAEMFIIRLRAIARSMRRWLGHVRPQLKYVRDRQETIDLRDFCQEQVDFWKDTLKAEHIEVKMIDSPAKPSNIVANKGTLVMVFDNVIRNARYWVTRSNIIPRTITVEVDGPKVRIRDSGPGFTEQSRESAFQPYFTTRQSGRGLGLFLARQFLRRMGASISIEESPDGVANIVELDFLEVENE